jgi:hypothetical protein
MRWLMLTMLLWVVAIGSGGATVRPATDATAVRNGEFRTWHDNGRLADVRRYVDGREEGLQQSWTADGVLFLNYEVRNGRRYGLINSRPCEPADPTSVVTEERRSQ